MKYWEGEIELLCHYEPFGDSVGFLLRGRDSVGKTVVMEERVEGEYIEPTFKLSPEATQRLMDGLWKEGFRPTEGTGSAGSLKATQEHLNDMRRIVFKKLGINN